MAVHPVADRPAGNPAVADLHDEEEFSVRVVAAVQQVGARAIAGRGGQFRALLAEAAAHHVEQARQRVGAAAERRGELRMQQRAVRDARVDQIVEPVVEQNLRIIDHDEIDTDEHLEHAGVEVEVDRSERLRVGAGPVEHGPVALAPDGQLHLVRAVPQPVVVDVVLERLRLGRDVPPDQRLYRAVGAVEQGLAGRQIGVAPEPLAEFLHALFRGLAAGHDAHQVGAVHGRDADVVENQVQNALVEHASLEQFDGRDAQPLAEDGRRVGRKRARQRSADVHLMPEHGRPADEFVAVEDRHEHQKIVDMRNGAPAQVRIVEQDDVAGIQRLVETLHHLADVGAELPDDHAPVRVADHGKLVVLFADDGRHGGPKQDRVHFVAVVLEGALDDVERDRVDFDVRNLGDFHVAHDAVSSLCTARFQLLVPGVWGRIRMFPYLSISPA